MKLVWSALLAGVGTTLGFVLVCIAPFVAVATLAARTLPARYAFGAVVAMWSLNQFVGFTFLHYPHAATTYGWGLAMGVAALLAMAVARRVAAPIFAFAAAFVVDELALFAYGAGIGEHGGFTPAIVAEVLLGNLVGLALLGAVRLVMTAGARRWSSLA